MIKSVPISSSGVHLPQGTCKLCHQTKDLRDSDFIPAAMYKYIRATSLKNPNPVVVGPGRTIRTSEQVRDYLLCAECEDRFNKNGEQEVLKWACKRDRFPLEDRFAVALAHHQMGAASAFSGSAIGVNTDTQLPAFAKSCLPGSLIPRRQIVPKE